MLVQFVTWTVSQLVTLAVVVAAISSTQRRTDSRVDELGAKVDRYIELAKTPAQLARDEERRRQIEEQNAQAFGIYS